MFIDYKEDVLLRLYGYGCMDVYEFIRMVNFNQSMFVFDFLFVFGFYFKILVKYEMLYDN